MIKNFLALKFIPANQDIALLVLRVAIALPLLLKHGLEKVFTFSAMSVHFADPLHIGMVPSLVFAMVSDAICTTLVIVGFATRWAALITFINVFVAWTFVHQFAFFGHGADHGELIVLYLGGMITIFLSGAGRYSIDHLLNR
jgi:putative oxidoreductase